MVDSEKAMGIARKAIEAYMDCCELKTPHEAYEAALIMVAMAMNLSDTLTNPTKPQETRH